MGQTIVRTVIDELKKAGIRSDEAYPGRRIPALTDAVAAVRLGRMDRAVRTTVVEVTIISPVEMGGSLCEERALKAVEILQGMGATCVKEMCRFDDMASSFFISVTASFFGTASDTDWSAGPGYTVLIGQQVMQHTVKFTAIRNTTPEAPEIRNAGWTVRLEELLAPGTKEPPDPREPFEITVKRPNGKELFRECHWVSEEREDTLRGVRQIRTAEAKSRISAGIL